MRLLRIAIMLGTLVAASVAEAQTRNRARTSRPSDRSGSALLGRLGGTFTRQSDVRELVNRGAGTGAGLRGRLPSMSRFGAARGLANLPPPAIPSAFTMSRPSIFRNTGPPVAFPLDDGVPTRNELEDVTSYDFMTDFNTPVGGWGTRFYREPGSLGYGAYPDDRGLVDTFFDVRAPRQLARFEPEPGQDTLIDLLEARNEDYTADLRTRAMELFARGTSEEVADEWERVEFVAKADDALKSLEDLGDSDAEVALLRVHAALLRGRVEQAVSALEHGAATHVEFVDARVEIREYFGTERIFERHLRRYLTIGDGDFAAPSYIALQAYCALQLGDQRRFDRAISRLNTARERMAPAARERLRTLVRQLQIAASTEQS